MQKKKAECPCLVAGGLSILPPHQTKVVVKSSSGLQGDPWLLTSFSRQCVEMWRARHGARFASYSLRKNKGLCNTGWKLRGSMKAISQGQGRATEQLMRMAKRDADLGAAAPARMTVLGMPRKKIMCSSSLPQRRGKVLGKKIERFRATTAFRRRAKDAEGIWTGFSRTPVRLRKKAGVVTVDMIAAPLQKQQQQPKPGRKNMRLAKKNIRNLAAPRGKAKAKKSKSEDVVVVDVSDLSGLEPGGNCSSVELSKWIDVVARGGVAKAKSSSGGFVIQRHSSTMKALKANLSCTTKFASKHGKLMSKLRQVASSSGCKWTVDSSGRPSAPKGDSHQINDMGDLAAFLSKIRMLPRVAGVRTSYLKHEEVKTAAAKRRQCHVALATSSPKLQRCLPPIATSGAWKVRAVKTTF